MPGFVPFMPAYPYPPYPPYGNFPSFPGRPPFPNYQQPSRGPGYPLVSGYPPPLQSDDQGESSAPGSDSDKIKKDSQIPLTSTESTQPSTNYHDPNSYYGGYGYPSNTGYESYQYSSSYNYYPGMEQTSGDKTSGVDPASQQPANPYGYNYSTAYGDQQTYGYDTTNQSNYYNDQNPPQN